MSQGNNHHLRHWDKLSVTDPRHTKEFQRPGGFKGTAIRPIWTQRRLTEHFGPAGTGWGTDAPEFTTVAADGEILVYCTLRCWYMDEGQKRELFGIGGDKVVALRSGKLIADDEAFKKAFTDALGNAFVRLGVSADVHMGLFENSKYVAEARKEFEEEEEHAPAPTKPTPKAPAQNVVKLQPPVSPPPHDTETGEILAPHAIPVPDRQDKWLVVGRQFIAAIRTAKTPAELDAWQRDNASTLASISMHEDKAYGFIKGALAKEAARLGPDLVTEDDASSVLDRTRMGEP